MQAMEAEAEQEVHAGGEVGVQLGSVEVWRCGCGGGRGGCARDGGGEVQMGSCVVRWHLQRSLSASPNSSQSHVKQAMSVMQSWTLLHDDGEGERVPAVETYTK